MKPIRIVRPGEIFMKEDEEGIEFYFYKHRNGKRKNYTYKVTYSYEIWKDALSEAGITLEDIKNHRVSIKLYPHGGIRFTKD